MPHSGDVARSTSTYRVGMRRLGVWTGRVFLALAALFLLLFVLMALEASGGHDGWLCEWGIDMDGAGTGDTGCG